MTRSRGPSGRRDSSFESLLPDGGVRPIETESPWLGKANEFVFPSQGLSVSIPLIAWPCLQTSYTPVSRPG
jgi:hypothetical protein